MILFSPFLSHQPKSQTSMSGFAFSSSYGVKKVTLICWQSNSFLFSVYLWISLPWRSLFVSSSSGPGSRNSQWKRKFTGNTVFPSKCLSSDAEVWRPLLYIPRKNSGKYLHTNWAYGYWRYRIRFKKQCFLRLKPRKKQIDISLL